MFIHGPEGRAVCSGWALSEAEPAMPASDAAIHHDGEMSTRRLERDEQALSEM